MLQAGGVGPFISEAVAAVIFFVPQIGSLAAVRFVAPVEGYRIGGIAKSTYGTEGVR